MIGNSLNLRLGQHFVAAKGWHLRYARVLGIREADTMGDCQPDVLSLGVSTSNPSVSGVDVWYRIQDRLSSSISNWAYGGSLESDKQGNFTIAFPASRVDQDLRSHRAWFDYQFVAVSRTGDVVGRSAKLAKQVTYTIDCED